MPHPRRRLIMAAAVALVVALVASACSSGSVDVAEPQATVPAAAPTATAGPDGETTPLPTPTPEATATPTPVPTPFAPDDDRPLPVDPDVRIGTLDNGLTYYLRNNDAPGGRVELRLAVNAGSALEDPDQSGVAHFLEHMLFNGTERYPANELIAVLEAFGSEFGPDVNAYTSYDETVYELSIPTDDPALVEEAFDVLREWATNASIDPAEVEAERGVVVEEWRLRDQGVGGRLGELYDELLTTDTVYEGRAPIGEVEALRAMTAEVLRRYYEDWYRPDLMAVVVVGEIDVDRAEALVRSRFEDIPAAVDPRPRPRLAPEPNQEVAYRQLADPEFPLAYVELVYAGPATRTRTVGDYRREIAYDLASEILRGRFDDDVATGSAPFVRAYASTTPLARDLATPGLLAEAPAAALEESFELLLLEVERIRRNGFAADELERARDSFIASVEQAYAGRDTTQDVDYAAQYVANFVGGTPMLSWDDFLRVQTELLEEMTPEYVAGVYLETIGGAAPEIVVVGPEADAALLPGEDTLLALLEQASEGAVVARVDDSRDIDVLMEAPAPAEIVERTTNSVLGSETVRFANGVSVALKTTTIAENELSFQGISAGGLSVLDESDLAAAFVAADVVTSSGVGDLTEVELDRLLASEVVSVAFVPGETDEVIGGGAATEDAETLFQLVHQYLTVPNAEESALATTVAGLQPLVSDPERIPAIAADNELRRARYGPGRRAQVLPSLAELEALTAAGVAEVFETMYADADDFTFALVGDFDVDVVVDLAARYLGTLPGDGEADEWIDHQRPPPRGVVERRIAAGLDPQGSVRMLISAEAATDQTREIHLRVLENILAIRLRDQLREALGATYSPVAVINSVERPDELIETFILVSGDPERLPEIVQETNVVLDDLRRGGVTAAEVTTAREQVRRDVELLSNGFWIDQLLYAEEHPEAPMLSVGRRIAAAGNTSLSTIQSLIDVVLPDDAVIVVSQVPLG